jgi:two-component system nitrate/nitrite response regulator NarL
MSSNAYISESFIANSHEATIPLAIADDCPLLIFGAQRLLAACQDIVVVAECIGFRDLLSQVALKRPKIILLGCETSADKLSQQLLAIAEHDPEAKVIVFTGNENLEFHEEALRNGARGVILKYCAPELITRSVRKVHRGDLCFDPALTNRMLKTFVRRKQPELPPESAKLSSLTERETQIIRRICQGMRSKEIAYELQISNATVAHNLTSIYRKLGVADRTELLLYAHRNQPSAFKTVPINHHR